jgi:hypothetical protein
MAKRRINELEDMSIETEKQVKKRWKQNRIPKRYGGSYKDSLCV